MQKPLFSSNQILMIRALFKKPIAPSFLVLLQTDTARFGKNYSAEIN